MSNINILFDALEKAINGNSSYDQFQSDFYETYHMKVNSDELTEEESNFFSEISEKFDFTADQPPVEDRKDGYIDFDEFRNWLKQRLNTFRSGVK